ncbi:MAG TPA: hypothetical protein VL244_09310 [Alphaproteobacteria bacterium]|nr:hypothetical protein [Alphaproteobacteria bacterium]
MRKIAISRLMRALGRLALVLMLGGGALVLALPAQAAWHGGHGGWHGGCCGWGWGPYLGFYGWPGYPYPYYPDYAYYPPAAPVVAVPAAPAAPAAAPAAANTWYYCSDSKAYYPYVQTCASAWSQVPATPPK